MNNKSITNFCRKLSICLVLICLLWFSHGISVQAAESPRVVRVGFYENKPKIYRDDSGQVTGLFGDILDYIAKQENWRLIYVDGTFDEGLNRLASGQIDVMIDVAFSDDRAKLYDFNNETVFSSWGVIYVKKDSNITSFKALDGKKVAELKSSIYQSGIDSIDKYVRAFNLNIQFVETDEYTQVFNLLSKGEVDAAVVSRISGLTAETNYPNIKATDIIFSPTELRFALNKNASANTYLIERLDFWIKQLHNERLGIYQQILQKHQLAGLIEKVAVAPSWLYPLLAAAVFVIFISWLLIIIFRRARGIALRLLAKKESYLSKVVRNLPVILSVLDSNGVVIFSEGKALQTGGFRSQSILDKSGFELFENDKQAIKNINLALSGTEAKFEVEVKNRVYKTLAYPVLQNGKVLEVVLISIDITEESYLNKAKKEFIYLVQHQLRTPPTIIKWGLESLTPKVLPLLDKTEIKNWKMLAEANTRMINLANTISKISEMESGTFPIKIERFDLPELITEIVNEFSQRIKTRKIKISTDLATVKNVSMDRTITDIIIESLISNAVYYTAENSVIKIVTIDRADAWVFKVIDDGIGIPENLKDKLFTPFARGDQASQFYPEGIGMGLYTTKTLLDSIGGKIWYESAVGKGSTFSVEIPKKIVPNVFSTSN